MARIGKIRELFETAHEADNAQDFMETLKVEFYADEVLSLHQQSIKRFRLGSTALDFAYSVHSIWKPLYRCQGQWPDGADTV